MRTCRRFDKIVGNDFASPHAATRRASLRMGRVISCTTHHIQKKAPSGAFFVSEHHARSCRMRTCRRFDKIVGNDFASPHAATRRASLRMGRVISCTTHHIQKKAPSGAFFVSEHHAQPCRFESSQARQRSRSRRRPEGRAKRVILPGPPALSLTLVSVYHARRH